MPHRHFQNLFVIGLFAFRGSMEFVQARAVTVSPAKVDLQRPEGTQQIVVYDIDSMGRVLDITRKVSLHIDPPNIAVVDERGLISLLENGTGTIVIQAAAERTTISITVRL